MRRVPILHIILTQKDSVQIIISKTKIKCVIIFCKYLKISPPPRKNIYISINCFLQNFAVAVPAIASLTFCRTVCLILIISYTFSIHEILFCVHILNGTVLNFYSISFTGVKYMVRQTQSLIILMYPAMSIHLKFYTHINQVIGVIYKIIFYICLTFSS